MGVIAGGPITNEIGRSVAARAAETGGESGLVNALISAIFSGPTAVVDSVHLNAT